MTPPFMIIKHRNTQKQKHPNLLLSFDTEKLSCLTHGKG